MLGNTVKMLFGFGGPCLVQGFWLKAQCLCQIRRAHLLHDDHGDGINCISSFSLKRLLWNQSYFENVIREVEKKTLTLWEEDNKGLAASGGFSAHKGITWLSVKAKKTRQGHLYPYSWLYYFYSVVRKLLGEWTVFKMGYNFKCKNISPSGRNTFPNRKEN